MRALFFLVTLTNGVLDALADLEQSLTLALGRPLESDDPGAVGNGTISHGFGKVEVCGDLLASEMRTGQKDSMGNKETKAGRPMRQASLPGALKDRREGSHSLQQADSARLARSYSTRLRRRITHNDPVEEEVKEFGRSETGRQSRSAHRTTKEQNPSTEQPGGEVVVEMQDEKAVGWKEKLRYQTHWLVLVAETFAGLPVYLRLWTVLVHLLPAALQSGRALLLALQNRSPLLLFSIAYSGCKGLLIVCLHMNPTAERQRTCSLFILNNNSNIRLQAGAVRLQALAHRIAHLCSRHPALPGVLALPAVESALDIYHRRCGVNGESGPLCHTILQFEHNFSAHHRSPHTKSIINDCSPFDQIIMQR